MLWWEGCSAPGTYAGIFSGGGGAKPSKQHILYLVVYLVYRLFLFSNVKSTYIGKYRLTLICKYCSGWGEED